MAALEDDARFQEDAPPQSLKIPPRESLPLPTVPANELPPFQIPGMGQPGGLSSLLQNIPQLQQPQAALPKMGGGIGGSTVSLSLPSLGLPAPPAPRPIPEPPRAHYSDPLTALGQPLTAMALIASAFTRTPATTAMRSLASGMEALKKGDVLKYQNDYREYEQQLQKAHAEQTQEQIDYKRDWENRRLSIQERQARMRGTATRRGDSAMLSFLDSGGDPSTLLDDRAKTGLPISAALEKAAAIKKIMKDNPGTDYATAQAKFTADKQKKLAAEKGGGGTSLGDPNLHGQEYLDSIQPPDVQDYVRAVAEGRERVPQGKWGDQVRRAAFHYNQGLRGQTFGARQAGERNFSSGDAAKNVTAINTLIGHLGRLDKNSASLNNTNWKALNIPLNKWIEQSGDPRMARTMADVTAVAAELGRVFKGTVTEGEIKRNVDEISLSRSPQAMHAAIEEFVELMNSRLEGLETQQKRTTDRDDPLLSPHAQKTLEEIKGGGKPKPPAEGEVMDGHRFKGGDPADEKNWEMVQ